MVIEEDVGVYKLYFSTTFDIKQLVSYLLQTAS
jgi:hypothetical protein